MPKILPQTITASKNAEVNAPIEIYDIQVNDTDWVHFADSIVELEIDESTVLDVKSASEFTVDAERINEFRIGLKIKVEVAGELQEGIIDNVYDNLITLSNNINGLAAGQIVRIYETEDFLPFWNGHGGAIETYWSFPIQRSPVSHSTTGEIDSVNVGLGNGDREISNLLLANDLRGKPVHIRKVFYDKLDDAANVINIFSGVIDTAQVSEEVVSLTVLSFLNVTHAVIPRRVFSPFCPWKFGGRECGYSGVLIAAGSTTDRVYLQTISDGITYQGAAQFAIGETVIIPLTAPHGNIRRVIGAVGSNYIDLTVALPIAPVEGLTAIHAECDKRFTTCERRRNTRRFGGFPQVPTQFLRRSL